MDLTFQVPMQYCSLQHQTLLPSPVTHTWVLFLLWLRLFFLSGVISPLISSSILGTYGPGEFIFQCLIFLPFHTVHGVLKARILKWFAIPFSSGPHSVRPLHHDPSVLGGPTWHGLVYWVRQAVGCVIKLAKCLWLWFQSVCPLMPSLSTYSVYLCFSYLGHGVSFHSCSRKAQLLPRPWTWGSFSRPSHIYGPAIWVG